MPGKAPARQRQWLSAAYQPGAKFREVACIRPERSSQPVEFAGHYVDAVELVLHAE